MDKKSNLTQIFSVLFLVIVAFYLGFVVNRNKEDYVPAEVNQESSQSGVSPLNVEEVASNFSLDLEELKACVSSAEIAQKVKDQEASGEKAGVTGTPGSFLVDTRTGKAITLGGAVPLATLESEFEKLKSGEGETLPIDSITREDFIRGNADARYAIIEWSDYECPFCGVFQETATQFVEGKSDVKWVYRQYPLDMLHPNTREKSFAALCVGKIAGNEAFWKLSDEFLAQVQ